MKTTLAITLSALLMAGCAQDRGESPSASNDGVGSPGAQGTESASETNLDVVDVNAPRPLDDLVYPSTNEASIISQPLSATDRALMNRVRNNLIGLTDNQGGAVSSQTLNNLSVQAHRGIVTVRGNVQSESEKQIITDRLQRMDGVIVVKNELQIAGAPQAVGGNRGLETGAKSSAETKPSQPEK